MSATPAIRTVVGGDSTSQEAQDYIHRFRILFTALTHASKRQIRKQASFEDLKEAELRSFTRAHFKLKTVPGIVCAKVAFFGCEAFKAAIDDLGTRRVMDFARHEADVLEELAKKEDEKDEDIVASKNSVNWMVEFVTLWIDAAN
ncbi:uncharacterized protein FPRO_14772 [Fusarium proliferatum ET1]|uniref:Uncharacterized protein n=1 Tax=Fusarium proliferatum (strain ET1) TaxID=1227346 RepID=A0A1L7WAV6_FUSPR|nr:uncharacterized protein FPRO_14772 [Fusarium proliferatum ET1]CZR49751.1 uncharacterized protein FPRO_14772 [Fusarium proliferatum ET1]